jgi:hypothetical protein
MFLDAVASEGASTLVVGSAARHGRVVTTPAGCAATVLDFPRHVPLLQGVSERFTSPPLVWGGGEDRAWP